MNFTDLLQTSKKETEEALIEAFSSWRKEIEKVDEILLPLFELAVKANEGGKRIRGGLVKLGFDIFSGRNNRDIFKAAATYEIIQTSLLIHDDIIDNSDLRRGKPSLHKSLGGDHYAVSQAICLADLGFFQAVNLLSSSNFLPDRKNKAISFLTKTISETILGEMLDIEIPEKKSPVTEELVMQIYKYKTARYTFVGPLQLGAILGGADENNLEKIKQFGDQLGIAFQIQDDIVGIFGTEKEIGKSVTSDIEEGKATLLLVYAKENASKHQLKTLETYYGNGSISPENFEKIKQIFLQTGSLDQARAKAVQYVTEAKKLIPEITLDNDNQILLENIADYLIERKK